jgi:hypothetical protein
MLMKRKRCATPAVTVSVAGLGVPLM